MKTINACAQPTQIKREIRKNRNKRNCEERSRALKISVGYLLLDLKMRNRIT